MYTQHTLNTSGLYLLLKNASARHAINIEYY